MRPVFMLKPVFTSTIIGTVCLGLSAIVAVTIIVTELGVRIRAKLHD